MLPISLFPKRFPCALPHARRSIAQGLQRRWSMWLSPVTVRMQSSTQSDQAGSRHGAFKHVGISHGDFSSLASRPSIHQDVLPYRSDVAPHTSDFRRAARRQQPAIQALNLYGPRTSEWWTGKAPTLGACPGMSADNNLYSLPQLSLSKDKLTRESLQAYFDNTWTLTEVLMGSLQGEEAFVKSPYHELRHPLIFYYGHPAALYVNKLRVAGLLNAPINSYFESIFETGVDEMSWDDLSKNAMPWPSVAEVHRYRKEVYSQVSAVIANLTDEQCASVGQSSPIWALAMAFEHERIHLETSSVLISEMSTSYLKFPRHFPSYHPSITSRESSTQDPVVNTHYPANEFVSMTAQKVTLGKPKNFPSFGWDNEYGQRTYDVSAFRATKFKISNGEFLEFVKDGGYAKSDYWSEDGWAWKSFRNAKWPYFWVRNGPQGLNHFDLRLIFDMVPMPWNWPVVVNFHEAHAYSQWMAAKTGKTIRVMTELEHHAIRTPVASIEGQPVDPIMVELEDDAHLINKGVNMNLSCSSMSPVDASAANSKGFHDVFGNAWEWTSDYFCALPDFEVHPYYEDFSTPCFDGLHHVIQGGSFISTGNECSVFSRFHFRPHFAQHASFRLTEQTTEKFITSDTDAPGPFVGSYPFRRSDIGLKAALKDKMSGGYNAESEVLKHFGDVQQLRNALPMTQATIPSRRNISEIILEGARGIGIKLSSAQALDVGCGAGGVSFDLAANVKTVIGIDHQHENVQIAKALMDSKRSHYSVPTEGTLKTDVAIANVIPAVASTSRIEFRMSDPMSLPAEMMGFDIVVINDVIDKVSSPNSVLGRLGGVRGLVAKNGLLAVISCFEWDANTTPKSLWLGGYVNAQTGTEVSSVATLTERLKSDFNLVLVQDQPVFWQESSRKYNCKIYSVCLFARK